MYSKKTKYALLACQNLARNFHRGARFIAEIAEEEQIPRKFLELILVELKNGGFLSSKKGKTGGYSLSRPPSEIMVGSIIRCVEGPLAPFRCASRESPVPCNDCPSPEDCGIRSVMIDARKALCAVLDATSLEELNRRAVRLRSERIQSEYMFFI